MLESLESRSGRTLHGSLPDADPALRGFMGRLRQHKLRPHLFASGHGARTAGLPLTVSVSDYLQSGPAASTLNDRLGKALAGRVPTTLALIGLDSAHDSSGTLASFCLAIKDAMSDQWLAGNLLGICVRSHVLPLQAFLVITSSLGKGPRYVFLDSLQMQHHTDSRVQAATDANWIDLWHRRVQPRAVQAVYSESVRSRCSLLCDQKTSSILPALSMPVPAESAWLPVEIFLPDFSDGKGRLHIPSLRTALHACLELNEEIAGSLQCSSPAQRNDSQINNRIALLLNGIGDLLNERRLEPSEIRSLRWVERVVGAIQNELWDHSKALARNSETLPSLLQTDPSNTWQCAEHRAIWRGRWQHTLQTEAVRNRNLLVLSPYSVLPRTGRASPGFTDLLPVLAHADAVSFRGAPAFTGWSATDFSNFHRRAWAVIMRDNRRSHVAAGV
ncbi:MAG: hypothetical protein OEW68_06200 [Gammaproteobacteria bacterium]|nr:hypothetical protein [Gammaproteobacteria bacterium]MDH4314417.1 hypothetical protein [Gammaproteobacteria bacterium]MDH5213201.1 hypothetical protein [Gammaproteobacteria bacterium]MDH5500260.1 hypothetical protein [Gammaproteobacteria bacterium]